MAAALKVLTLDLVKLRLRLTARQTHLDESLEELDMPGAEAAAETYLGRPLTDLVTDSGVTEPPYPVPGDVVTALLYYLEADLERDPKTQELYIKRAENLLYNHRANVGV